MLTQGDKARIFTRLVSLQLLPYIFSKGYEVTFGEAWRPPEMANIYAERGQGISNSLHLLRLALDINLYRNGKWLQADKDFEFAGEFWESLSTLDVECCWGGRFGDGNHFSIKHNGVR